MTVDISNELNTIKSTQLGRTMRPALHDAIHKHNEELNRSSALIDEFIKNAQQVTPQNAEIVAARIDNNSNMPVAYDTLGERLDTMKEDSENKVATLNKNLEQTNAQLSRKINKGEGGVITNAMLSQEVKEAMTGGSVAVVGRDTVLTENIVDRQVTRNKTNYYTLNYDGNLISDLTVYQHGYMYLNDGSKLIGDHLTLKLYRSDIDFYSIPIRFNMTSYITFWTVNDVFISGYIQGSLDDGEVTDVLKNIPSNADYVLFGFFLERLHNSVVSKESNYTKNLKTTYHDNRLLITKDNLGETKFSINNINELKLNPNGNLIEKNKLLKGKYYNIDGDLVYASNAYTFEFNLNKNSIYEFNFDSHITFWDKDDKFISGYIKASLVVGGKPTFSAQLESIPQNAKKVKMLIFEEHLDFAVFSLKSSFSNDLKCTYYVPGFTSDIEDITNKLYEYGNLLEINKLIKGLVNQNGVYDPNSNDFTTDFLEIKDYKFDFVSIITFWNNDKEFISGYIQGSVSPQYPATLSNIPDNAKYVRFTVFAKDLDAAVLALTNTYKSNLKTYYYKEGIVSANENINNKLENNPLFGKSFVFFGDSWCAGNTSAPGGWAEWIRKQNPSISIKNCGVHGQDWNQAYNTWVKNKTNWDSLSNDYDYVVVEAYTNGLYNDLDKLKKPLGAINEFVYYKSDEEIISALGNTYACDLELFLFNVVNRWHGKKIGLMFPYKAVAHMRENNSFRNFRSEVIKCANKYNIPIFDNFNGCNIPTWSQEFIDLYFWHGDNNAQHGDEVHLNAKGYEVICPPIENWIKSL